MRTILFALGAATMLGACAPALLAESTPDEIDGYQTWFTPTPQPVNMAPVVALSCVGPAAWDRSPKNPHVRTLFKVFVNAQGKASMRSKGKVLYPTGSVIVKEKYELNPDRSFDTKLPKDAKPVLLTVMIKREKGYASKNGDWEYRVYSGDGQRSTGEVLKYCAACHETQKEGDYVFGVYDKGVFTGRDHFKPLPPELMGD